MNTPIARFLNSDNMLANLVLTRLRDQNTSPRDFRASVVKLTPMVLAESMKSFPLQEATIATPMATTTGYFLPHEVAVVPIFRAGLGMLDPMLEFFPNAQVGHLVIQRDEETAVPRRLLDKLPDLFNRHVFLIDIMLATGGSACDALDLVKAHGGTDIRLLCLVAAPQGVAQVHSQHPDVPIFGAVLDERLDERKYIIPGLGDAGDRLNGS